MAALNGVNPEDARRAAISPRPKGRGKNYANKKVDIDRLKELADHEYGQRVQRIHFAEM